MKQKLVVFVLVLFVFQIGCEVDSTTSATSSDSVSIDGEWEGECISEIIPVDGGDDITFYRKQTYIFEDGVASSVFTIYLTAGCDESQEQFRYDMLGSYSTVTTGDNTVDIDLFISVTTATYGSLGIIFLQDDCPGDDCFLPYPVDETPVAGEMYDNLSVVENLPATGNTIFDIAKLEDGVLTLGDKGDSIPRTAADRPAEFDDENFAAVETDSEAGDSL